MRHPHNYDQMSHLERSRWLADKATRQARIAIRLTWISGGLAVIALILALIGSTT